MDSTRVRTGCGGRRPSSVSSLPRHSFLARRLSCEPRCCYRYCLPGSAIVVVAATAEVAAAAEAAVVVVVAAVVVVVVHYEVQH